MKSFESVWLEASLRKANAILRVTGIQTDNDEKGQTFMERVWKRKFFMMLNITTYIEVACEVAWFIQKGIIEKNFLHVTYTVPCVTFCFLGSVKCFYRIKYGHHIADLIYSLRKLQAIHLDSGKPWINDPITSTAIRKMIAKLSLAFKILTTIYLSALAAFAFSPLVIMGFVYHTKGVLELRYPFLVLYPFDGFDLRVYPFIYIHQMVCGTFAVFTVFGPDCLYYTFCTFVQVQFRSLQYDLERIIKPSASLRLRKLDNTYRMKFRACVNRHTELIRCSELIETVYSKSALFNFMTSSLLLCLAGFNIMVYVDLAMFSNFICFLFMCLMQIYLICDYGDNISNSSLALSDAVYNSQWYNVDAKTAKDLLMILTRAQKPCKLTASSFTQMNLAAFTGILSRSWSYFALLQSVYNSRK